MHRRLLTLARDSRFSLFITVLSGLLAGLLTIWQAWLLSSAVDGVFLQGQSLAQVTGWLRLLLVIITARGLLAWVNEVSANAVAVHVKTNLRKRLFAHIQALGPAYTRAERTGDLTAAAVEGIEALDAYFSQYLPQLVITALVPLSILLFVFPIDLLSGVILLLTAPLIPFFMILIGKGAEAVTNRQYETLSRLSAHFLDSLQGLTTLKILGQSKAHVKNIARVSDQFRDRTMAVLRITFLSALALELLATLSTAIIAVEIGLRLLYAKMEFKEAFFLLILAPEFYLPLRMLGARFHAGMAGTSAARRIFEILDIENREQRVKKGGETPLHSPFSIHLDHVSFTYPDEPTPALNNINLQIQSGQHIALVGPSGAGKSTLVNLLLGFIQPSFGKIVVHEAQQEAHATINHSSLTKSISWVPQRPYLFHDTIANNILLGKPEATPAQLEEAAKAAYLHEFITSLPDGYQTVIGEGGARLSGGQAQRLALARAFLKDAAILILDEPTSSLDPETESLLEESTGHLMQDKTVITIAHRLNTIFQADLIIVLEKGQVVEQGMHSELMTEGGAYAGMVGVYGKSKSGKVKVKSEEIATRLPTASHSALLTSHAKSPTHIIKTSPILPRLLSFLRGSWGWVALSVLLGALTIASNVSLMGASAWLISTAALHPSIAALEVAIVGVRFFGITRGVFRYTERLVSHDVTFRLLSRLRVWFYEKLEPLAPARLMDYRAGDLLARIIGDVEILENFYVRVVAPPLVALLTALGVSVFLASFHPPLATVLIGFFLSLGLILPIISQTLSRRPGKALIALRADLNVQLVDGIQGLADILAYNRGADRLKLISETGRAYGQAQRHMARISGLQSALTLVLTNLGMWTVLYLTIPLISTGRLQGVMLGTLALLTLASFEAVTPLPQAAQMWESVRTAAGRLFEVVDAQPVVIENREQRIESAEVKKLFSTLEFSNLSFAYPGQGVPAIQNISFNLKSGRSLAIVGPSGAGKSTIVNLLLRFWEYSSGDIRLGGESLHSLEQDEVRERCAVVSQSSYLFNASVRQNLCLARPSASQEEIEGAAQQAQIHEFILGLPKGYDTFIGEQGTRLSGGERQRLTIARVLLKDAPILILDEPTANLDPLTEKQVLKTLFGVMKGKTSLLITHRLVGLENVGEIVVMEHGEIVERGTQAELLEQSGTFRRMWDLQNRILSY
ncbi:MAG: thiol reductant ABC exporter subunit CydD [Anaerolineales bacterium]